MSTVRLIGAHSIAPQRWRNGGGVTRELLAWPADAPWRARISVADITVDGDFSAYPGVERWFTVLSGAGVELHGAGCQGSDRNGSVRLRPGDAPLRFDGGAAPRCRLLDGATRDLNLMLRGAAGAMRPVVEGVAWSAPRDAACGLFSAVAGRCAGTDVPPFALLWFDRAPPRLVFDAAPWPAGLPAPATTGWWLFATPVAAPWPGCGPPALRERTGMHPTTDRVAARAACHARLRLQVHFAGANLPPRPAPPASASDPEEST